MKIRIHLLLLTLLSMSVWAHAQGTTFNYQGRLLDNGIAANGSYDFVFTVQDAEVDGNVLGAPVTLDAIAVSAGQFSVPLDFGTAVFDGSPRWLEISVRASGAGARTSLAPRQALLPTPYAIFAESAGKVANASVTADQLITGGVPPTSGQFLLYAGGNLVWSEPGQAVGDICDDHFMSIFTRSQKVVGVQYGQSPQGADPSWILFSTNGETDMTVIVY